MAMAQNTDILGTAGKLNTASRNYFPGLAVCNGEKEEESRRQNEDARSATIF
jgi:hypothetical protein